MLLSCTPVFSHHYLSEYCVSDRASTPDARFLFSFAHIWICIWNLSFCPELLTIMIATRFLDSVVGNNRFQSIFCSIHHNIMIVTYSMTTRIFKLTMILELINGPGRLSLATLVPVYTFKWVLAGSLFYTVRRLDRLKIETYICDEKASAWHICAAVYTLKRGLAGRLTYCL